MSATPEKGSIMWGARSAGAKEFVIRRILNILFPHGMTIRGGANNGALEGNGGGVPVLFAGVYRLNYLGEKVQKMTDEPENKMRAVAKLFGKKLNQPFKIRYMSDLYEVRFSEENGLEYHYNYRWWPSALLDVLLTGKAEYF